MVTLTRYGESSIRNNATNTLNRAPYVRLTIWNEGIPPSRTVDVANIWHCLWGVRLHRIDLSLFEALCFKLASLNQLCFCGISHGISMVKPPEIYQSSSILLFWGWLSLSLWTASSILQWGFMGWSALFWDHGPPFQMGVPKSWVMLILHPLVLLPTSSFWYPLVS